MKTERIRLFAILLAALLMVTMLPVAAFADGEDDDPDFYLESYTCNKSTIYAGNTFVLTLTFHAASEENLDESYLVLDNSNFQEKQGKVIYKFIRSSDTPSEVNSTYVSATERLTVTLTLTADKNLAAGGVQYPFAIKLKKEEADAFATIAFSSVYVRITAKPIIGDDDDESEDEDEVDPVLTPHLVITSVSTAGQQLPKDENFSVTVNFKNTSKNIPLENIILTVAPGSGLTLPKASTNFYIEKIKAGETVSQTFTLYADDDAVTGAFSSLGVSFSYQYMANDAYIGGEDAESVSLFFGSEEEEESKEDRFDILDMQTPDYLYPNEENYLTFTIINKGSAPINNIMGKIESPALSNSGASEYFGQLAANTKDELELPMVAMQSGDVIGTVTITYELEDGTEKMIVRDFTAYAEEVYIDDPGEWIPEEPTTEETGGIKPYWYFIGGGVLAAAGLTAVLVRRAKKKKAMALADDEI